MSKRPEYKIAEDTSGRSYWRSLAEYEKDPALLAQLPAEFPPNITEPPDGISRRTFFNLMGASAALAGLAACRRPEEKIVPYAQAPEEQIPGKPLFYATAMTFAGTAVGVLVESHDGRPTKIEGNPSHPASPGGGVAPWVQASVLDMYDPDRSDRPRKKSGDTHKDATWKDAAADLTELGKKLRAAQGAKFAVVVEAHRSPTLAAQLAALKQALPQARFIRWEAASRDAQREGARLAFGRPFETVLTTAAAKVIVALDADILHSEGSTVKNARGFAEGRKLGADMNRLYVAESTFTVTGSAADHRLRLASRDVSALAFALAAELGAQGVSLSDVASAAGARAASLPEKVKTWARAVAKDLVARKGAGLIVAGAKQPAAVHAVVHAMNHALENIGEGKPVKMVRAFDDASEGPQQLVQLADGLSSGAIDTVLVLGGNPAFDAPGDAANLPDLLAKATVVHLSSHFDETSQRATWHLNRSHWLEAWSDALADDGTPSIVQPLIAPLFDSRSDAEVVSLLLGKGERGYDMVRATWMPQLALGGEKAWRAALHDGVIANVAGFPFAAEAVNVNAAQVVGALRGLPAPAGGFEVTFAPDAHAWDGRFANNAWLQEWTDPMHKQAWGNHAAVSPATAKKLGVKDGEVVAIQAGDSTARVPVIVAPGQADDSIAVTFGQGREKAGRVGNGVGSSTYGIRASTAMGYAGDVKVTSLGGDASLARTQEHFSLEGRPHVREGSLAQWQKKPNFVEDMVVKGPPLLSLWKEPDVNVVHAWGMSIDLNVCTGCSACQVACQAENNIPVVGAEGVRMSREMNWLRVDRYFEGTPDDPRSVAQPLPCQHCENAPCEQVCPVAATTHSPEGLNDMAYNRCVGTRYCANNCPFKVRKYNFLGYTKDYLKDAKIREMQFNPDVTVRSRGVMEKCTFCVQRINEGKIAAKVAGTDKVADGAIQTACQQACPTGAIVFGDLNDKESRVAKAFADQRGYKLLEEINVQPRVKYLAKIRNHNPELENA